MHIDLKSFILGAIVGGCFVVFRASVSVAKDKAKPKQEQNKQKVEAE